MAGYEAIWHGLEAMEKAFTRAAVQADLAARENVKVAAMTLIRDAQANFAGSHKKGEPHRDAGSTEFGQKPNVVTGNLRRSIMADSLNHYAMGVYSTQVGPTMKYGRRVELGLAPTGPYPYFGPAAAKLRTEMGAIATANWARYIKY